MVDINDYNEEKDCIYRGEHYSVRDNGAILRHVREGMRKRKFDNVWTYGNLDASNGYLFIGSVRVHIIVATAFGGVHDSKIYVVDHIDTNRQNNRPDNLRWMTRLENILLNEITRKKIELLCGSVEAFLNNPSLLQGYEIEDRNFIWMKNVSKEEAKNCLDNWINWARTTTATHDPNYKKKKIGDWIYQKSKPKRFKITPYNLEEPPAQNHLQIQQPQDNQEDEEDSMITDSPTPFAAQYHWKTPTEFPCCPDFISDDGLLIYENNLKEGNVFSSNKYDTYYVVDKGMWTGGNELMVLATNNNDGFLSWSIVSIKMRNDKYVHKSIERKANKELASKFFKYLIGKGDLSDEDLIILDCL
jgi:hypothetical protein